jgi:predicted NUDIX family phosphoesterase
VAGDTELVMGLQRHVIPGGLGWRGVRGVPLEPYLAAVQRHGTFRPRDEAEDDPAWKQVIPYLLLRDGERLFLMRRTRAGGDERLHDLYTIGVGGHVNPDDGDVLGGLRREWAEEIESDFEPEFEAIGILNDDDNAVGAVHLGFIFGADAGGRPVGIRETHKLEGAFATLEEVAAVADRLETWSSLLFDFLISRGDGEPAGR